MVGLQSPALGPPGRPCVVSAGKRLSVLEEEALIPEIQHLL